MHVDRFNRYRHNEQSKLLLLLLPDRFYLSIRLFGCVFFVCAAQLFVDTFPIQWRHTIPSVCEDSIDFEGARGLVTFTTIVWYFKHETVVRGPKCDANKYYVLIYFLAHVFYCSHLQSTLYKMEMPSIPNDALTKSDMHIDVSCLLYFIKLYYGTLNFVSHAALIVMG